LQQPVSGIRRVLRGAFARGLSRKVATFSAWDAAKADWERLMGDYPSGVPDKVASGL